MPTTVVNIHKEECDFYIGRKRNTKLHFGNPFIIGKDGDRKECIRKFKVWLEGGMQPLEEIRRRWILENMHKMKDKKIGCYCVPEICHGDIYAYILDSTT